MRSVRLLFLFAMLVACRRAKHGDAYKMEQVDARGARACAAMRDGTVRCWGRYGDTSDRTPTLISGMTNAAKVCVAENGVCALGRDGKVSSCMGQTIAGASDLACTALRACAITNGKVLCWAENVPPREMPGTEGAKSVAMGGHTGCAILGDGSLECWGAGTRGQLGNGAFEDHDDPVLVPNVHAKAVSVGEEHTCAVLDDETLACFGSNDDGQLGDGTLDSSAKPRKVENVTIAQQVSCGSHHTCARMGDSTVHCWGRNDVHQAGLSTQAVVMTPTLVPGLYESTAVIAGDDFTCVRMQDGWLRCFGVNDWGQLADGTREIRNVPNPIRYE